MRAPTELNTSSDSSFSHPVIDERSDRRSLPMGGPGFDHHNAAIRRHGELTAEVNSFTELQIDTEINTLDTEHDNDEVAHRLPPATGEKRTDLDEVDALRGELLFLQQYPRLLSVLPVIASNLHALAQLIQDECEYLRRSRQITFLLREMLDTLSFACYDEPQFTSLNRNARRKLEQELDSLTALLTPMLDVVDFFTPEACAAGQSPPLTAPPSDIFKQADKFCREGGDARASTYMNPPRRSRYRPAAYFQLISTMIRIKEEFPLRPPEALLLQERRQDCASLMRCEWQCDDDFDPPEEEDFNMEDHADDCEDELTDAQY